MSNENKITFADIGVSPNFVKALNEDGIYNPTKIQEDAIPLIRSNKNLVGISRTGSGKTLAFSVPVLEKIERTGKVQVLVLSPTRELAVQISEEMGKFSKYQRCNITTIYGGVAINPQMDRLQNTEVVVGTPGRLLDHLERGTMDLSNVRTVVLDEADKMVEMGFIEDIERILSTTPTEKQMLLFGATISTEVDNIKRRHMPGSVVAEAEKHVEQELLKQYYYNIQMNEKFSLLVHMLRKDEVFRAIVFCSTRNTVELITRNLKNNGVKAEMIHGKLSQNQRLRAIENFNKGRPNILIASSVAARGLDIKDVTHVFNYDLSQDAQEYVHRVGRTARAGEQGVAITLLCQNDFGVFNEIIERYKIPVEELPLEEFKKLRFEVRDPNSRDSGRGRSFGGPRRSGGYRGRGGQSSGRGQSESGGQGRSSNGFRGPRRNSGSRENRIERSY
ncbi:MAG: DEAD/DEAH box helicase [archaeon]|nr:DEAD/DEAH box helicase [Nanoarchaeota archaeon]